MLARVLAVAYCLWAAFVGLAAGSVGAILSCEGGCQDGSPPWLSPWAWDDYDVAGTTFVLGLLGVLAATAFAASVFVRRWWAAIGCLAASVVLLSYPFFAGLTGSGQLLVACGLVLGVGALVAAMRSRRPRS